MHVNNMQSFGHLVDLGSYSTDHRHNDLYQIIDNQPVSPIQRIINYYI